MSDPADIEVAIEIAIEDILAAFTVAAEKMDELREAAERLFPEGSTQSEKNELLAGQGHLLSLRPQQIDELFPEGSDRGET